MTRQPRVVAIVGVIAIVMPKKSNEATTFLRPSMMSKPKNHWGLFIMMMMMMMMMMYLIEHSLNFPFLKEVACFPNDSLQLLVRSSDDRGEEQQRRRVVVFDFSS